MFTLPKSARFTLAVVPLGVVTGIIGMLPGFVLHMTEYRAFRLSPPVHETCLEAISASTPLRRVLAPLFCGVPGGIGWFSLKCRKTGYARH